MPHPFLQMLNMFFKYNLKIDIVMNSKNNSKNGNRMNEFATTNKKIEKAAASGYKTIESGVVSIYKAIEDSVVSGYKKIENKFVEAFLI
jgi:hypothetical protein